MNDPKMLSILDAARSLGIGRSTLYMIIKDGRLPARKLGRRTLIHREDLDLFVSTLPRNNEQS